jgi:hypothetical protein
MFKNLWRNLWDTVGIYAELSPDELHNLVLVRNEYQKAIWSLDTAKKCIDAEIEFLQKKIDRIDSALELYPPDSFYSEPDNISEITE